MLVNLLKNARGNISCAYLTQRDACGDLGRHFVLPEDGIAEDGAGDPHWCGLDGSERFQLQLLLFLNAQVCLGSGVGLLPHLRLQVVRVVSAPSDQEHPAQQSKQPLQCIQGQKATDKMIKENEWSFVARNDYVISKRRKTLVLSVWREK